MFWKRRPRFAEPISRFPYGSTKQSQTVELIHDAFQGVDYWKGKFNTPGHHGVAIDTHIYQVFSDEVRMTPVGSHYSNQ